MVDVLYFTNFDLVLEGTDPQPSMMHVAIPLMCFGVAFALNIADKPCVWSHATHRGQSTRAMLLTTQYECGSDIVHRVC